MRSDSRCRSRTRPPVAQQHRPRIVFSAPTSKLNYAPLSLAPFRPPESQQRRTRVPPPASIVLPRSSLIRLASSVLLDCHHARRGCPLATPWARGTRTSHVASATWSCKIRVASHVESLTPAGKSSLGTPSAVFSAESSESANMLPDFVHPIPIDRRKDSRGISRQRRQLLPGCGKFPNAQFQLSIPLSRPGVVEIRSGRWWLSLEKALQVASACGSSDWLPRGLPTFDSGAYHITDYSTGLSTGCRPGPPSSLPP